MQRLQELYNAIQNDFQTYGARLPEAERQRITNEIKRLEQMAESMKIDLVNQQKNMPDSGLAFPFTILLNFPPDFIQVNNTTKKGERIYGAMIERIKEEQNKTTANYFFRLNEDIDLDEREDGEICDYTITCALSTTKLAKSVIIKGINTKFNRLAITIQIDVSKETLSELPAESQKDVLIQKINAWANIAEDLINAKKEWEIRNITQFILNDLVIEDEAAQNKDFYKSLLASASSALTMRFLEKGAVPTQKGLIATLLKMGAKALRTGVINVPVSIFIDFVMGDLVDLLFEDDSEKKLRKELSNRITALHAEQTQKAIEAKSEIKATKEAELNGLRNNAFWNLPESNTNILTIYICYNAAIKQFQEAIQGFQGDFSLYEQLKKYASYGSKEEMQKEQLKEQREAMSVISYDDGNNVDKLKFLKEIQDTLIDKMGINPKKLVGFEDWAKKIIQHFKNGGEITDILDGKSKYRKGGTDSPTFTLDSEDGGVLDWKKLDNFMRTNAYYKMYCFSEKEDDSSANIINEERINKMPTIEYGTASKYCFILTIGIVLMERSFDYFLYSPKGARFECLNWKLHRHKNTAESIKVVQGNGTFYNK